MAGWAVRCFQPHLLEVLRKLQSVGFCPDLDPTPVSDGDLGLVFDRILAVFSEEICSFPELRPLPAMLGDGRTVGLFALYRAASAMGGYKGVTACRGWGTVAEEIGVDPGVGSALKLVYAKYLDALERWLTKVMEKSSVGESKELVCGLGKEVTGLVLEVSEEKSNKHKEAETTPGSASKKDHFLTTGRESGRKLKFYTCATKDDNDEKVGNEVAVALAVANGGFSQLKRKREDLAGMLNWVKRLAIKPRDFSDGNGKTTSSLGKSKVHSFAELINQALQARQAMFVKNIRNLNPDVSVAQNGQVHPSFYGAYYDVNTQTNEKRRCSERLRSLEKDYHAVPCSDLYMAHDENGDKAQVTSERDDRGGKHKHKNSSDSDPLILSTKPVHEVSVGPSFQAELSQFIEGASVTTIDADELKWLGTTVWPPKKQETRRPVRHTYIGKGREKNCNCRSPGSVTCVRVHVVEKRLQLKRDIGTAFCAWRFDSMGEEVALSWTPEEERRFKTVVHQNPASLDKNFWNKLYLSFPDKSKQDLVSYYFNVFTLSHRAYQNRVTPHCIDSDDDESEFGILTNPLGHQSSKINHLESHCCAQNSQCSELDE